MPLRYVLDTNVLVAAFRSEKGASRRILLSALDQNIAVILSVPLMVEYDAVLTREDQLKVTGLTTAETNAVLDAVVAVSTPVQLRFLWRPQLKDPADEMMLETAVNGGAQRLVTFNLRHLGQVASKFGIIALTPPDAWKEIVSLNEKK
jgi:putative PIN family toxin of toxin-antitoxin system